MKESEGMTMRKNMLISVLTVLFMICSLLAGFKGSVVAGDDQATKVVVSVKGMPDALSVDPVKLKKGHTVIWMNEEEGDITIRFITKLGIACGAPTNFYADLFGYYETTPIQPGGTASICFIRDGKYEYEVKRVVDKEKMQEQIVRGHVIVE